MAKMSRGQIRAARKEILDYIHGYHPISEYDVYEYVVDQWAIDNDVDTADRIAVMSWVGARL